MTVNKKYSLLFLAYLTALFISPYVYSYVFDVECIGPEKRYDMERQCYEREHGTECSYMSYSEWLSDQERKEQAFLDYLCEGIHDSFNITGSASCSSEYRGDMNERGRD